MLDRFSTSGWISYPRLQMVSQIITAALSETLLLSKVVARSVVSSSRCPCFEMLGVMYPELSYTNRSSLLLKLVLLSSTASNCRR